MTVWVAESGCSMRFSNNSAQRAKGNCVLGAAAGVSRVANGRGSQGHGSRVNRIDHFHKILGESAKEKETFYVLMLGACKIRRSLPAPTTQRSLLHTE